MNRPQPPMRPASNGFDLAVLAVLGLAAFAGGVLWLGAQAASLVRSHRVLDLDAGGVAAALRHMPGTWGDPRFAFEEPARSQLPGPVLFWSCVVVGLRMLCRHRQPALAGVPHRPDAARPALSPRGDHRSPTGDGHGPWRPHRPSPTAGALRVGALRPPPPRSRMRTSRSAPPPGAWATTRRYRLDCPHRPQPIGQDSLCRERHPDLGLPRHPFLGQDRPVGGHRGRAPQDWRGEGLRPDRGDRHRLLAVDTPSQCCIAAGSGGDG